MFADMGISLLWPDGKPNSTVPHWQDTAVADLGLESVIRTLNIDGKHERAIKDILLSLCDNMATIRYRQEILTDLLNNPNLLQQFENLLKRLDDLENYSSLSISEGLPFQKTLARLGELELYVQTARTLTNALNAFTLRSPGLLALRVLLRERVEDPLFQQIERELPTINATTRDLSSMTLGINLDHDLRPIAATIISLNVEPFRGSSMLQKLFGNRDEFQGISPLHTVPPKTATTADGRIFATTVPGDPLIYPLFKDLDRIITDTIRPTADALKKFLHVNTHFLIRLGSELVFYLGAVRLIEGLAQRGLPMVCAEIAPNEERTCTIKDCYNLHLALRTMPLPGKATTDVTPVVGNDVVFDDNARILIVTGPNQGGKTTYIQAIALAQVMFQAGLYVPGSQARISPVDGIYTHFPVEEKPNTEAGRFGEEALRLGEIFSWATPHSLILLNESLTTTASGEGLYLARDIVRCLRLLGVRAAYATHMHELAASADELNATTPGTSNVISMVAIAQASTTGGMEQVKRTYKVVAGPPMGRSYARDLALRYGISLEKIVEKLTTRGTIDPVAAEAVIKT